MTGKPAKFKVVGTHPTSGCVTRYPHDWDAVSQQLSRWLKAGFPNSFQIYEWKGNGYYNIIDDLEDKTVDPVDLYQYGEW